MTRGVLLAAGQKKMHKRRNATLANTETFANTKKKKTASQRGIKKQKIEQQPIQSRKASRLSGAKISHVALDYNVHNWNNDNTPIVKLEQGDDADDGPALVVVSNPRNEMTHHLLVLDPGGLFVVLLVAVADVLLIVQ